MEPNNGTITQGTPYKRSIFEQIIGKNYDDIPVFRHLIKAGENFKNSAPGKIISFLTPNLSNGMIGAVTPGIKLANPEEWVGIEDAAETLTKYHRGYNGQAPIKKFISNTSAEPVVSNWQKFLNKTPKEQNDIIKYWFGEKYNSLTKLKNNTKDYNKFIKWINKQ